MAMTQDINQVNKALEMLAKEEFHYKNNQFKMWLFLLLGIVIGGILSPLVVTVAGTLNYSFYDRSGLDEKLKEEFGENRFSDITVDELVIAAFEYNSMAPRFFSKFMER